MRFMTGDPPTGREVSVWVNKTPELPPWNVLEDLPEGRTRYYTAMVMLYDVTLVNGPKLDSVRGVNGWAQGRTAGLGEGLTDSGQAAVLTYSRELQSFLLDGVATKLTKLKAAWMLPSGLCVVALPLGASD